MFYDVTGKELAVGDKIVYSDSNYATLQVGYVVGITPRNIRVSSNPNAAQGSVKNPLAVAKVD